MSDFLSAPAADAVAVTPSDVTILVDVRGLYVGTGGSVVVTLPSGTITFANVPSGALLPVRCTQVRAASTASNIVALK